MDVYRVRSPVSVSTFPRPALRWGRSLQPIHRGKPWAAWFRVRNLDGLAQRIDQHTLIFELLDFDRRRILTREARIEDEVLGIASIRLTTAETAALPSGPLRWSLVLRNAEGEEELLFLDDLGKAAAQITVLDELGPVPPRPYDITGFTPRTVDGSATTEWIAGPVEGPVLRSSPVPLFTVQVFFTEFTGDLFVEGAVSTTPPGNDDPWSLLGPGPSGLSLVAFTGTDAWSFRADVAWIRVRFVPDPSFPDATVDRILVLV